MHVRHLFASALTIALLTGAITGQRLPLQDVRSMLVPEYRGTVDMAAADIDGDGTTDLVVATRVGLHVHLNLGSGVYRDAAAKGFRGIAYHAIETADLDGDGDADIAAAGSRMVDIYENQSTKSSVSFVRSTVSISAVTGTNANSFVIADLAGNALPDIFIPKATSSRAAPVALIDCSTRSLITVADSASGR